MESTFDSLSLDARLIGTIVQVHYLIGDLLGSGSFGRVYAVTDTRYGVKNFPLAIKVCTQDSENFVEERVTLMDLK